jgi:hypothetical protein
VKFYLVYYYVRVMMLFTKGGVMTSQVVPPEKIEQNIGPASSVPGITASQEKVPRPEACKDKKCLKLSACGHHRCDFPGAGA